MKDDWAKAKRRELSSDGSDSNPSVTDFFKGFSAHALSQLRLWLEDEVSDVAAAGVDIATFEMKIISETTTVITGDGQFIFAIPEDIDGWNLTDAQAYVTTVSSSGLPTVQVRNVTQTADMLSTKITIDVSEFTSYSAATPSVVDSGNDDVATGDLIAIDVDVAGTGAKGLGVILTFALTA